MSIIYKVIDSAMIEKTAKAFGDWVKNCISIEQDCYSIAALLNGTVVGFISGYSNSYPEPLIEHKEAYIDVIEVAIKYRRMGIAREMINLVEIWAIEKGCHQVRAWSSDDKIEAISMWYALNYCVCPAWMKGYSKKKGFENKPISGVYAAKVLF